MGVDCKSIAKAYEGSNPSPATVHEGPLTSRYAGQRPFVIRLACPAGMAESGSRVSAESPQKSGPYGAGGSREWLWSARPRCAHGRP